MSGALTERRRSGVLDRFALPRSSGEALLPHERIVVDSSTGPVWTWIFEPDPTGTTLTLAFGYLTKVPLMDKVVDRVGWHDDRDLDTMLAYMTKAIET